MPKEQVIGFDIRVPRAAANPWHSTYLIKKDVELVVSIDPFVFPIPDTEEQRRINEASDPQVNFCGLLVDLPRAKLGEWIIAATISHSIAQSEEEETGEKFIISSLSSIEALESENWHRIGYDVVELESMISGLMNCGPHSESVKSHFYSSINKFGLLNDLNMAGEFALVRGNEIPAHSPFIPVSIWVHNQRV